MTLRPKGTPSAEQITRLSLDLIDADEQVRRLFDVDAIQQLARSLKSEGQLQPIRVRARPDANGQVRYVVIAGERRLQAARFAELDGIDAIIVSAAMSDADVTRCQLVENCLRENLEPLEQAAAFRRLMELEGLNATQLAERLNLHKATVSRCLSLLDLPGDVQEPLRSGDLSPAAAREIGRISDPELRRNVLTRVMAEQLKADDVAKLVNSVLFPKAPVRGRPKKERTLKLGAFDAVLSAKRILILPASKKSCTPAEQLSALLLLVDRLKAELDQQALKSPA